MAIVELFQSSIACSLKILEAMGHALQLKVRHMSDLFLAVFHAGHFGGWEENCVHDFFTVIVDVYKEQNHGILMSHVYIFY